MFFTQSRANDSCKHVALRHVLRPDFWLVDLLTETLRIVKLDSSFCLRFYSWSWWNVHLSSWTLTFFKFGAGQGFHFYARSLMLTTVEQINKKYVCGLLRFFLPKKHLQYSDNAKSWGYLIRQIKHRKFQSARPVNIG